MLEHVEPSKLLEVTCSLVHNLEQMSAIQQSMASHYTLQSYSFILAYSEKVLIMSNVQTKLRICPLCEATCGLELDVAGREVLSVAGDSEDDFSEGYLCPKGVAVKDLDADTDRLRTPMIRRGKTWHEASWDEAFAEIESRLKPIVAKYGKDAVGLYLGNPVVHNTSLMLYVPVLRAALGTRNVFSASSVDQVPKQLAVGLMFGNGMSVPIPDIDRCAYLLILGANPLVSNGSLMTAPNVGERLKRLQARGGKIVVIDPVRTKTAAVADEHHFIQPGYDALFLLAIVQTLFAEDLVSLGKLAEHINGLEAIEQLAKPYTPDVVANACGIEAATIQRIAREIAAANGAAVYGRIGTCTQQFGTVASWLIEVIHVLTGNLDREGGAMFTLPAHGPANSKGTPGKGRGLRTGRWASRVRGCHEVFSEFPVACLSEEIETPGEGQVRALVTVAGNPVLSTPNGQRLSKALDSLDFMLSFDIFLNETTSKADVILPGLSPLENSHYDVIFSQLAVRNYARYSPRLFEMPAGQIPEWESILRCASLFSGNGQAAEIGPVDDAVIPSMIQREAKSEHSAIHGRDPQEIMNELNPRVGPERILDFMLRTGPYGDGFGQKEDGLTLATLEENPHGIDLGAMQPRIPEVLRTGSGQIELAPELIVADLERLKNVLNKEPDELVLIGRRHLRSNNSWMHNVPRLVSGKPRCTLQLNPVDAKRCGIEEGDMAAVTSRVGRIEISAEVTDDIQPGVVSIPHGWGHDDPEIRLGVASAHAGVNSNILADEAEIDIPSGNAVLCGIPVKVGPA